MQLFLRPRERHLPNNGMIFIKNNLMRLPFALVLLFSVTMGSFALSPSRAYAADFDSPIQVAQAVFSAAKNTITAASGHALVTKEYVLDPIVFALGQQAIHSLTKSTVNWINSGFQGSPAYATDLSATLQDAADVAAEGFLNQMRSQLSINSPFRDTIAQNVLQNYYLSTSRDSFFLKNPYTLNQFSPDDKAFLNGGFEKGGFPAYLSSLLNCQNNPICAQNSAENELNSRIASVQGTLHEELGWGNGVFSFRKCDLKSNKIQDDSSTTMIPVLDANGKPTGKTTTGAVGALNLNSHSTCLSSHIETPGSVIAAQLNHSLGLGADSLVQANEFDEIVNALMGQLMKNVLGNTGLGGLSRGSAATGGRTYFDQTPTSNTSAGVSVLTSFLDILAGQSVSLQTYVTNWQTISTAATAAKSALQQSACVPNASAIISSQVDPVLTQAATAIGSTPAALTALDNIRSSALAAVSLSVAGQTEALQKASADYDALQKSNTLPLPADVSYAAEQSIDTGSASPASLLTKMNQLAAQARCGT
jgi:hypothetical protein